MDVRVFRADLCVDPIEAVSLADYQRLDNAFTFLTQCGGQIAFSKDGDDCWLHWPYGRNSANYEDATVENQRGVFNSPLEAIEAEMKRLGKL